MNDSGEFLPLWGGIEQTVHRLGDNFGDQLLRNGHHERLSDLDEIAALGIKTLRYPIIWERVAPKGLEKADWNWVDERLNKMRELGINPIAGLLHHGSGPSYTSLIDPDFPQKFVEYAVAVAQRYPWLELFTPINEPLTTARFSCLYGLWYPHSRDDISFALALFNQCKAIVMAMQEIKKIIPTAKLVQTEDLGKCHATPRMQYQADFENQRRWISLDLIAGQLDKNPVMKAYLRKRGNLRAEQLDYFADNNYPPDIIGINHYITSERFLDENRKHYPAWSYASNGRHQYCDLDITRVDIHRREGHYQILKSAAERYGLPIALTEVHIGSSRDAQLRWLMEAYKAATQLKQEGVDIRAVTSWSLFGAYDWNSLLTQQNNFYEPGIFDVRSGKPRATALAKLVKTLNAGEAPDHPVLQAEGWWKNREQVKFEFGSHRDARGLPTIERMFPENLLFSSNKPILIIGANGTLGRAFAHICTMRNIFYVLLSRNDVDIANEAQVNAQLEKHKPWAVINAAGFVRVDDAEAQPDICYRENTLGPEVLAKACAQKSIGFLTFSSDLVFNGNRASPYCESHNPEPLNIYGLSKWRAEKQVMNSNPAALIIRTSAFFGPWDGHNFLAKMIGTLKRGQQFYAAEDQIVSPTYVPDLVNNALDLLIDEAKGIWHLSNPAALSWADFAKCAAEIGHLDARLVKPVPSASFSLQAQRPAYSALASEKGIVFPSLDNAIERFFLEGA